MAVVVAALVTVLPPVAAGAQSATYQGEWSGTTSQGHPISFSVGSDGLTRLSVAYLLEPEPGEPCSFTEAATATVTYATPPPIVNGEVSGEVTGRPAPVTFVIRFSSQTQASGSLQGASYNTSPPGSPRCVAKAMSTTFDATNSSPVATTPTTAATPGPDTTLAETAVPETTVPDTTVAETTAAPTTTATTAAPTTTAATTVLTVTTVATATAPSRSSATTAAPALPNSGSADVPLLILGGLLLLFGGACLMATRPRYRPWR